VSIDNQQYFICLEYRNPITKKYGKSYLSFNEKGLVYDVVHRYSLEQIDKFLAIFDKKRLYEQLREDNVLYFLNEIKDFNDIFLSIHHYDSQNGKERVSASILKPECYFFDIEKFFKENMTILERKNIYNKLGGYLTNNHMSSEAKSFIQHFQSVSNDLLWQEFQTLSYFEQRKIKQIIFDNISSSFQQSIQPNQQYTLKKDMA
jgi:hypothetical protein